ncbi:MAG TPA: adenylyltransferase/cytidyltransferase family protein [Caulobacteraceae bacterium]|jgi:glycerol-3-phosphate cytidylyltransferase
MLNDPPVKVITYGTYDLFHIGHLNLLERLRALGDHLVVAISTDEFNLQKGKICTVPYADRARIVASLRCVDQVIPERSWEQKADDITRLGIGIFGMGDDWVGRFDFLSPYCRIVYLPRTEGVSTTSLKAQISQGLAPPIPTGSASQGEAGG